MKKLHLNTKQLIILLMPLFLIAVFIYNKSLSQKIIDNTINIISGNGLDKNELKKIIDNNSLKDYYISLSKIKKNYNDFDKTIFELDKELTSWSIAYIFKPIDSSKKEQKNGLSKNNTLQKYSNLQKMIYKRNIEIDRLQDSNQYRASFNNDKDLKYINKIIQSRNLKINYVKKVRNNKKTYAKKINIKKYNLQMISYSSDPEVIINGKVYSLNDYINKNIKISKIYNDKILLKNQKEQKWLNLIN